MHPLSIKSGDFLSLGFANNNNKVPVQITNVVQSVVNGLYSYAVTVVGGTVYTCTAANTTIQEKNINVPNGTTTGFKSIWVLGA